MTKRFFRKVNAVVPTDTTFLVANTILIEYAPLTLFGTAEIPENARFNTLVRERNVTIYATNIRCDIRAVDFSCSFSPISRRAICVLYQRCFVPVEKTDGTLYSGRFFASLSLFLSFPLCRTKYRVIYAPREPFIKPKYFKTRVKERKARAARTLRSLRETTVVAGYAKR